MISVVFCTRESNDDYIKHLVKTSGLYKSIDIIEIVNNGISLSECYKKGIEQAKFDTVVFCHDDIILETKNWGKKLLKHFDNTDFGILGLAGTTSLTNSGRWWDERHLMLGVVNHQQNGKKWTSKYSSSFGNKVLETVLVDGLFFAVRKDRLKYGFDTNVEGFHFYDLDFTFGNHINGCKVGVMFDIRVTHLSVGQTNQQWEENRVKFVEKWSENLPLEIKGEIFYNDKEIKIKKEPKINIIIPTKGNLHLLFGCINSIYDKSKYSNFEVLVADTGSTDEEKDEIKDFINKIDGDVRLIEYDYYNFAKINNDVVKNHLSEDCELLLFCNNDIQLINDAISNMVKVYQKNKFNTGTIGARLHFENNRIQHAGILSYVNQKGGLEFTHLGLQSNYNYSELGEVIGNTAAFLLMRKDLFNTIGGFNEGYIECFEDVELNLQCLLRNKKNIFVGNAVCYHFESITRGKTQEAINRLLIDYRERLAPFMSKHTKLHKYIKNLKVKN